MKMLLILVLLCLFASPVFAEDTIAPVIDKLDELAVRVESGISLNSYAEALAEFRIAYKKAATDEARNDNPLLHDKFKEIMIALDDYAKAWRLQENDKYTFILRNAMGPLLERYPDIRDIGFESPRGWAYHIAEVKRCIFAVARERINKAKSLHVNRW